MNRIILYGPAFAPYTEKVARGLGLKKLPFELIEPESAEDYRRYSPKTGLLPVITIDGGEPIADSTQILFELDERFPEPPLLSRDANVAARQRRLEDWADESFFWYWTQWRAMLEERGEEVAPLQPYRFSWLKPRTWFEALAGPGGVGVDRTRERFLLAEIEHRLDDLVGWLGTRPYFHADEPSMADLGVYAMLRRVREGSFGSAGSLLDRRPMLLEFMRRLEQATEPPSPV